MQRLLLTGSVLAILISSTPVLAQPAPPPPAEPSFQYHEGFLVGIGLGLGIASPDCTGCDSETSLGLDFQLGGFINPRLAIMYDAVSWADSENDITIGLAAHTAAAQYWVAPRVWIKGGLGFSYVWASYDGDSDSDTGNVAITAGAGYELSQTGNFVFDVSGRLTLLNFDGGDFTLFHVLLGARWW